MALYRKLHGRVRVTFLSAIAAVALPLAHPLHAAILEQEGRTRVLLITTHPQTAEAFVSLTETLQQRFAVSANEIRIVSGPAATANRIEDELLQTSRSMGESDTLFVVVALAIRGSGGDRTVLPADYRTEAPGSGLSTLLLEKIIIGGPAGSAWLFLPECTAVEKRSSVQGLNAQQSRLPPSPGGRATIAFCEREPPVPGLGFMRVLTDALRHAADAPTVRAPWMRASDAGFITSETLFDQLALRSKTQDSPLQVRLQTSMRGGALLRVASATAQAGAGLSQRLLDASDDDFRRVLNDGVSAGRLSATAAKQTAQELVAFIAADPRDARRSLAVQAIGALPAEAAVPSLIAVYRNAGSSALVRQTAIGAWRAVAPMQDNSLTTEAMRDTDAEVRLAVVRAVAAAKDTSAAEFVKAALLDERSEPLRAAAAAALPDVAPQKVAETALVAALKDPSEAVRIEAATALGRIAPSARASRQLTNLLEDAEEPRVLAAAAYATANVWSSLAPGSQGDVEDLTEELVRLAKKNEDAEVREAALFSLKTGKRVTTAPEIERMLGAGVPQNVREEAVDALGTFAQPSSVTPLSNLASASEASLSLRVAAVTALAKIRAPEAASEIWRLAASEKTTAVSGAARVQSNSLTIVPPEMRATLTDTKAPLELRLLAVTVAGETRDRESIAPLLELLGHTNPRLRAAAVSALSEFSDLPLSPLKEILASKTPERSELRASAAQVLASLGTAEARKVLLSSGMQDPEEKVRAAVATAMGARGADAGSRRALHALASDESPLVRAAAASALGGARTEENQRALQLLANDPQPSVRAAAVEALRAAQARTRNAEPL